MELHVYFAFVIATAIMIAMPGPSVLLVIANSISFGWKYGFTTVLGASIGVGLQLILATIGLTSLLNTVASAFEWLRWGGAIYLIYLGIKQWRCADQPIEIDSNTASKKNVLYQGIIVTLLNPKSLVFIAAFLPQFIDVNQSLQVQFMIILPTFLILAICVTSIWVFAADKLRGYLKNQKIFKSVTRTTGGMIILAGIGIAMARRGN